MCKNIKRLRLFEIFKEQFQLEKEVDIRMIKTEERINLDTPAYNSIRL